MKTSNRIMSSHRTEHTGNAVQTLQHTTYQLLNSYNATVCLHTYYSTKHHLSH